MMAPKTTKPATKPVATAAPRARTAAPSVPLADPEQIRRIVEQVVSAADNIHERRMVEIVDHHIETVVCGQISQAVADSEARTNKRLLVALGANLIPLIVGVFFLGQLWERFENVPRVLDGRAVWIRNTEARISALETHAAKDGTYTKPEAIVLPD